MEGERPRTATPLRLSLVAPGTPEWAVAVGHKRARARDAAVREGLDLADVEERYDRYEEQHGVAYHDQALRDEVGEGRLLAWWGDGDGSAMVAYAPLQVGSLMGDASRVVLNVADLWIAPKADEATRSRVVADLVEQAKVIGAARLQLNCDHAASAAVTGAGGEPVRHWFEFRDLGTSPSPSTDRA